MPVQNPQELFVRMLSDVRHSEQRTKDIFHEMIELAQDPDVKEILAAHVFLEDKLLSTIDQCFKIMGKQPVQVTGRLHEVFVEDFRRELNEIQAPIAKALYVANAAKRLLHLHIGEYVALTAMADVSGHYGVGALIETCLADNLAFVERMRRRVHSLILKEVGGRMGTPGY